MQIYKASELSKTQEKTIARFRYYYDNRRCFALIGDYVVAVLSDSRSHNLEKLKEETIENSSHMRNTPPDFNTYVMDDQFGLVEMNYGIYAVSPEPLSDEELKDGKVHMATALAVRVLCLEACEAGQILAVIDEEL